MAFQCKNALLLLRKQLQLRSLFVQCFNLLHFMCSYTCVTQLYTKGCNKTTTKRKRLFSGIHDRLGNYTIEKTNYF